LLKARRNPILMKKMSGDLKENMKLSNVFFGGGGGTVGGVVGGGGWCCGFLGGGGGGNNTASLNKSQRIPESLLS